MRLSLPKDQLAGYLGAQLDGLFPGRSGGRLGRIVEGALERVEHSFRRIILHGYSANGEARFSHLHGDQYAAFLYFAANLAWKDAEDLELATRLFLLNKALNGIVVMYDTQLPEVFVLMHTVGTVLGKANYGNYFVAAQNVTVGMDRDEIPTFGERVVLYGGCVVVGGCSIGDRVTVAANAMLRGEKIPSNSIVAGASPELAIKPATRDVSDLYFAEA